MKRVPELDFFLGTGWLKPGSNLQPILETLRDAVTVHPKKLKITDGLSYMDPGLLSSVVMKFQGCTLDGATPDQQLAILGGIRHSTSTSLKHLDLRFEYLHVAPDIVAGAAMKLETLEARLSRPQVVAVITMLAATEDSRLRHLELESIGSISTLDPEIVAGALIKLQIVGPLLSYSLSAGQVSALFSRICDTPVLRLNTQGACS